MPIENIPEVSDMENKTCIPQETMITNVKLAQAYVPFQKLCTTLTPEMALMKGTTFPELISPWVKTM